MTPAACNILPAMGTDGDPAQRAYERAIRLLARRAHAREELYRKLVDRGVPKDLTRDAVARVAAEGYLDDLEFARSFARDARDHKGWAPARIKRDLARRGASPAEADEATREQPTETDLLTQALVLARKRAPQRSGDRQSIRRRLAAYLERRGFPVSVCRAAVDDVAPF